MFNVSHWGWRAPLAKQGGSTPDLVQMVRVMTLYTHSECERKFRTHTGDFWTELSTCGRAQVGLGEGEGGVWSFVVAKEQDWRKVAHARFKFPAGTKGGGEVTGLLISLSRCGAKGKGG